MYEARGVESRPEPLVLRTSGILFKITGYIKRRGREKDGFTTSDQFPPLGFVYFSP